jgi:hypothetical protein
MSSNLKNLMEMGFSRDKAQRALKRAKDDIEQATNFLVEPDDEDDSEVPDLLPAANIFETIGIPTNAQLSYSNPSVPTAEPIYPAGSGGKSILSGHLPDRAPLLGRRVVISGLVAKPELNGRTGMAVSFDDDKGRYAVELDDTSSSLLIKPCNLQPTVCCVAHEVAYLFTSLIAYAFLCAV